MFKQFITDFNKMNVWQKLFFVLACGMLIFFAAVHTGLLKIPQAFAQDCSKIQSSKTVEIIILDDKFDPEKLTVNICDRVKFINESNQPAWPAVGPHPTHSSYPGFDAKRGLNPGETFEVLLDRPGTYGFHEHLRDELTGTVTIK